MWRPYIATQGDYLTKLAHRFGFNAIEVWNDSRNSDLKATRSSMDMLAPGDIIHIPVVPREGLPFLPGKVNRYVAKVPKVDVVLAFKDAEGAPLADEPYEVQGLRSPGAEGRTDGEGRVALKVPITLREVTVLFPERHFSYSVRIGDLDPGSEMSGIRQRLQNLGYLSPDAPKGQDESEAFVEAIFRFQATRGLPPTGALDDATRQALLDQHGI